MKGTFILKMAGITEQIILLKCPSFSCADTYARTHSTYSEEEGTEGGIFCNQRNGNMLLVRLMPTGREEAGRERREGGGKVGLVCGRGENMGDSRRGALELWLA